MTATVTIVGEGKLAALVSDRLSSAFRLNRQLDLRDGAPKDTGFALVLTDGWNPALLERAEEAFRASGTPWLPVFAMFGEGVVGPFVRPDRPGCSQCAEMRRLMAGRDRPESWALRERIAASGGSGSDPWASSAGLRHLAALAAEEAERYGRGETPRTEERVYLVHLRTLNSSRHFILPEPTCPYCGNLPEDSAERSRIALREMPKVSPENYRTRPMKELENVLERDYVDPRTGLLNVKLFDFLAPFADASVNLPLNYGDEGTAGRTHRYSDSVQTAILEGLERRCGLAPRGKRTVVRDSCRRLGDAALDPASVGLHDPALYERPDFPFQSFDPDREMDWVWGYSFLRERPILVPEQLAYYSTGCGRGFVYETSNGCALGGSLEEAIFHGILEAAERDSFLMTWYARLPLRPLDLRSAGDEELLLMAERLRAAAGFDLLLFDSTMEHGIPCIWSIAKNRTGRGVNLICAAGAHPDPVKAVKSAVHELAGMLQSQHDRFERNRDKALAMLTDPYRVREMEDHSLLYALPEAESRFDFLLRTDRSAVTFEEAYGTPVRRPDLTEELKALLHAFLNRGMDVIVVDQSTPETLRNGLHCVKVLIPGMLPMTFGYHLTRLHGLDRVLRVPADLGYAKKPLEYGELNPHPHPFP